MADHSKIEWTEATWNPVTGCSVVSPGCTNCYAMGLAGTRLRHHPSRAGLTKDSKAGPVWTGEVRLNEDWLDQPLRWARPRRIFVCAHGDLFHESVPEDWIDRVFAVMALAPQHNFQVLTKRADRMRVYLSSGRQARILDQGSLGHPDVNPDAQPGARVRIAWQLQKMVPVAEWRRGNVAWPLPNVWLGVSAEDQRRAEERIPLLLETPAALRWVSAEPLLGPVNLTRIRGSLGGLCDPLAGYISGRSTDHEVHRIDWVVAGGESGKGARPMHPEWARGLRDQCAAAGVPFFFKQWGEWLAWRPEHGPCWVAQNGRSEDHHNLFPADFDNAHDWDDGLWAVSEKLEHFAFQRVGKKAAGALLDGREHRAFPRALSA